MNKRFTFTVFLAIVFALTSLLLYAHVKTQYEEIWNYKYSFFLGTEDLIDNYQFILEFEKSYLTEKDIDKKKQMVENHANQSSSSDNERQTHVEKLEVAIAKF
ncbi:hypothetical protein ACQKMI_19160 [Lysinibacillus sp. NPDC097214]|uniref:hypothetical protein n=1 Tax=Lysinibacillus sp. NPDC097214 TaxID=3390584 RepID=UPI003D06FB1C